MIIESQIRFWLARFLAREVSLECFEDWFVQQSWDMHQDSEPNAQKVVASIELRLAEYTNGHLSEDDLRDELRPFASIYVDPVAVQTSAQNTTLYEGQFSDLAAVPYSFGQAEPLVGRLSVAEFEYSGAR